jgi:elongation factor Tu
MQGIHLRAARVEYETRRFRYVHIDCKSNTDCITLLSARTVKLDGVILVVSAVDGPTRQTRKQIRLAHARGIKSVVVYINKIDLVDEPMMLDLVELETRELLSSNEFNGDEIPVIRGSALAALNGSTDDIGKNSVLALLNAMDDNFAAK